MVAVGERTDAHVSVLVSTGFYASASIILSKNECICLDARVCLYECVCVREGV